MLQRALAKIFPFTVYMRGYSPASLRLDVVAGLTVALILIPQSMAYAQLAGLPAYYGLYAAFLPPLVAALFGSSQQLATGPVAVVSLMTAASLEPLARAGSEAFIAYAVLLALVVGIFQLALGLLRLGLVVNFLSHPVINGFTNAAAIIIASSQLGKIFGVQAEKSDLHYETVARVLQAAWHHTHWPTLFMGGLAFAIMYGLKRFNPKIPYVLVAVVLTTVLAWATGFEHHQSVALDALRAPEVRSVTSAYNLAMGRAARLEDEREVLGRRIKQARRVHGPESVRALKLTNEVSLVNLLLAQEKVAARLARASLRDYRFLEVGQGEKRHFYRQGQAPPGAEPLPGQWRLKVGRGPLDQQALVMMRGGAVVGRVPAGLPSFIVPSLDGEVLLQLLPYAVIISLLGFMEAISIAKAMAAQTGQRLDPNQELVGQGLANMVGSTFLSYPVSGSFSRSAVNLQAGAKSSLASVFTTLGVGAVLLFFTPLLYHLPQAVLAAVIMMAVVGLINFNGFVHAWRAQWYDGVISILTFLSTLVFAPHLDRGIMIGVALSLLVFLYKSMRPRVVALAMAEDSTLHDTQTFGLAQCDRIAVIRFDGPLFFANASFLEDQIARRREAMPKLRHILLVCEGMNDMDASGEESLALTVDRVRSAGFKISLAHVHSNVLQVIKRTHLLAKIGEQNIYPSTNAAIQAIHADAHQDMDEAVCPLLSVCHNDLASPPEAG